MRLMLVVHILCGTLGWLSGYVALYAAKGGPAHRKSGMLFVSVMLTLAVTGFLIAAVNGVAPALNISTAALTFYMVVTGLSTVRPPSATMRRLDAAATAMAFAIGIICTGLAVSYFGKSGAASANGYPLIIFGMVATGAGIGDARVLRWGPLSGAPRLKRHLWRMCFALFVASLAFFAPRTRLPVPLRIPALRFAGAVTPLVTIAYWMWRLRIRRAAKVVSHFALSHATAAESAR